jgi:hypothetical protein
VLIFFLGVLLGVLFGGLLCAAYLRQEIAASVGPKLRGVELQLSTIENLLGLAVETRRAELYAGSATDASRQPPHRHNY